MSRLLLASTSVYRRELLARLRLPFDVARPDVDEAARDGEPPDALAMRLARAKAEAVAAVDPTAWVLGSDQVADLDGEAIGKPGHHDAAATQLRRMSGRRIRFHTAVALAGPGAQTVVALDTTTVHVRTLGDGEILRYLEAEPALDCAGSFKSEGLGIALFDAVESIDPTALVGLPLIATARLLRHAGFTLP